MSPDPFLLGGVGAQDQIVHACHLLPRQQLRTLLIALLFYLYSDVAKVTHQLSFITKFIVYCMHSYKAGN